MHKHMKLFLIGLAAAIVAFFVWRWWTNRQSNNSGDNVAPGGSTDLNSVAPELIGGSSGPNVGPAVSLPVNITLTEQADTAPKPQVDGDDMEGGGRHKNHPLHKNRPVPPGPGRGPNLPGEDDDMQPAGITSPDDNGMPNGGM